MPLAPARAPTRAGEASSSRRFTMKMTILASMLALATLVLATGCNPGGGW